MDDPALVRGLECFGDLPRDRQRLVKRASGLRTRRCARSSPSTSSITKAVMPLASSTAVNAADVGVIQRSQRGRFPLKPGEAVRGQSRMLSDSIFSATSRCSLVSRAPYTSPIPPAPSGERISYGPRRMPGLRAKRLPWIIRAARSIIPE